jgi:hypothetical protein
MGTAHSISFKLAYKKEVVPVKSVNSFADLQRQVNSSFATTLHLGIHSVRFMYKPTNFEVISDRDIDTVRQAAVAAGHTSCVITLERNIPETTKGSFVMFEDQSMYPVVKLKSGLGVVACGIIEPCKGKVLLPSRALSSLRDLTKHYLVFNKTRLSLASTDLTYHAASHVVIATVDLDSIPTNFPSFPSFSKNIRETAMCTAVQADSQHFLSLEISSVTKTSFTVEGEDMMLGAAIYDLDWHLMGIAVDARQALRVEELSLFL